MTILFTKNPKLKIYKFSVKLKDCQYNHNFCDEYLYKLYVILFSIMVKVLLSCSISLNPF